MLGKGHGREGIFEKSIEEVIKGNLSFRIRLRKKDEAKELAEAMNRMIETLLLRMPDQISLLMNLPILL